MRGTDILCFCVSILFVTLLLTGCDCKKAEDNAVSNINNEIKWEDIYSNEEAAILYEDLTLDGMNDIIVVSKVKNNDVYTESMHIFDGHTMEECIVVDAQKFIDEHVQTDRNMLVSGNEKTIDAFRSFQFQDSEIYLNTAYDSEILYPEIQYGDTNRYSIIDNKLIVKSLCYVGIYEVCGYFEVIYDYNENTFSPKQISFQELANNTLFESTHVDSADTISDGVFVYSYYKHGLKVIDYLGNDSLVSVPVEFKGIPIICIGKGCFKSSSISLIYMPSILEIGENAFAYNDELAVVYATNVQLIGSNAFMSCDSLSTICIDNVISIERKAFDMCSSLTNIHLPAAMYIGYQAFYNTSISDIYLPVAITVNSQAFADCFSLRRVFVPNVSYIGHDLFFSCDGIELITRADNDTVSNYFDIYHIKEKLIGLITY